MVIIKFSFSTINSFTTTYSCIYEIYICVFVYIYTCIHTHKCLQIPTFLTTGKQELSTLILNIKNVKFYCHSLAFQNQFGYF